MLNRLIETSVLPSGLNTSRTTGSLCPSRVARGVWSWREAATRLGKPYREIALSTGSSAHLRQTCTNGYCIDPAGLSVEQGRLSGPAPWAFQRWIIEWYT